MSLFNVHHIARSLRKYRQWHQGVGISIALLVLISSLTGILLAWKKDIDVLQPPTQKSIAVEEQAWLPIETLASLAQDSLAKHLNQAKPEIDRMDVRPAKGIVKVNFTKGYWEVQVDGYTGNILSIARRHSDWIEQVHDGSIVSDLFKLVSMNSLGLGLLILTGSGIWLWFGPRRIRKIKKRKQA